MPRPGYISSNVLFLCTVLITCGCFSHKTNLNLQTAKVNATTMAASESEKTGAYKRVAQYLPEDSRKHVSYNFWVLEFTSLRLTARSNRRTLIRNRRKPSRQALGRRFPTRRSTTQFQTCRRIPAVAPRTSSHSARRLCCYRQS